MQPPAMIPLVMVVALLGGAALWAGVAQRSWQPLLIWVASLGGAGIAYVDSRPGWDDTGVTATAILALCGLLGMIAPERP